MAQTVRSNTVARPHVRIQPPPAPLILPSVLPDRERYLDVEIGPREVRMLIQLIECDGIAEIAKAIGVGSLVLLRVGSGMIHHCTPKSQLAVRRFFASGKK